MLCIEITDAAHDGRSVQQAYEAATATGLAFVLFYNRLKESDQRLRAVYTKVSSDRPFRSLNFYTLQRYDWIVDSPCPVLHVTKDGRLLHAKVFTEKLGETDGDIVDYVFRDIFEKRGCMDG
ncbi:hypothetical protein RQP46_003059 [Phenoliferia psychrophenolica]